jgi:hypothetical protein
MNGPMRLGGGDHPMSHCGGENQIGIPLIPAPIALLAMIFGLMVGIMIGRKKSMMHGMGSGMGGHMDMRGMMMSKMAAHHHHGDGMCACGCGGGRDDVAKAEPTTGE